MLKEFKEFVKINNGLSIDEVDTLFKELIEIKVLLYDKSL